MWNSVFEDKAAHKPEAAENEAHGDIHINMAIDTAMNLQRLRVCSTHLSLRSIRSHL